MLCTPCSASHATPYIGYIARMLCALRQHLCQNASVLEMSFSQKCLLHLRFDMQLHDMNVSNRLSLRCTRCPGCAGAEAYSWIDCWCLAYVIFQIGIPACRCERSYDSLDQLNLQSKRLSLRVWRVLCVYWPHYRHAEQASCCC